MFKNKKIICCLLVVFFLIILLAIYPIYCFFKDEERAFNKSISSSFSVRGNSTNKEYIEIGNNSKAIGDLIRHWGKISGLVYISKNGFRKDSLLSWPWMHFTRKEWKYDEYGDHLNTIEKKPAYGYDFDNFSEKEKQLVDDGIQNLNREVTLDILKAIPYTVYGNKVTDKNCSNFCSESLSAFLRYYLSWFKEHYPNKSCSYIFSLGIKLATSQKIGCYSKKEREEACLNSSLICLYLLDLLREHRLNKGEKIQCLKVLEEIDKTDRNIDVLEKEIYEAHLKSYEEVCKKYPFYSTISERIYGSGIEHIKRAYKEYQEGKRYSVDYLIKFPFAFTFFYMDLDENISLLKEEKAARAVLKSYLQAELDKPVMSLDPYDKKSVKVLDIGVKKYFYCASSIESSNVFIIDTQSNLAGTRIDMKDETKEIKLKDFFLAGDLSYFNSLSSKRYLKIYWHFGL